MSEEPKHEMVPVESPHGTIGQISAPLDPFGGSTPLSNAWTTLDVSIPTNAHVAQACFNVKLQSVGDCIGKTLVVTDILRYQIGPVAKEDGEILTWVRTVLIGKDGPICFGTGQTFLDGLRRIAALFGPPPWPQGMPITVDQISMSGGSKRIFQLTVPSDYRWNATAHQKIQPKKAT